MILKKGLPGAQFWLALPGMVLANRGGLKVYLDAAARTVASESTWASRPLRGE
jgi:hypothetical protein